MPNGYGSLQVYFPSDEAELLNFIRALPKGKQSEFVRDAVKMKRAADGEETPEVSIVRRVIREELKTALANADLVVGRRRGRKKKDEKQPTNPDLDEFMAKNTFGD